MLKTHTIHLLTIIALLCATPIFASKKDFRVLYLETYYPKRAQKEFRRLKREGYTPLLTKSKVKIQPVKVRIGPFAGKKKAQVAAAYFKEHGFRSKIERGTGVKHILNFGVLRYEFLQKRIKEVARKFNIPKLIVDKNRETTALLFRLYLTDDKKTLKDLQQKRAKSLELDMVIEGEDEELE